MAREQKTLDQTLVYLEILKRIPRRRSVSTQDLLNSLAAAGIELPLLTLQRYLKVLTDSDVVPVRCDRTSRPYSYRLDVDASPYLFSQLTPQESLLLKLAKENLRNQLPAHITKAFDPIFEAADENLVSKDKSRKERAWLKKVAVVANSLPQIPPTFKARLFDSVSEALYDDRKLEITYRTLDRVEKTRKVSPLGLVQQDRRLYLVCQFESYDNIRHLPLHRMIDATVLAEAASKVPGFDLNLYVRERHFNYSSDEPQMIRLVLEFTKVQTVNYLTESPLSRDQTIKEINSSLWRLEATVEDSLLLDGWIRMWQDAAGISKVEKVAKDSQKNAAIEIVPDAETQKQSIRPEVKQKIDELLVELKDELDYLQDK